MKLYYWRIVWSLGVTVVVLFLGAQLPPLPTSLMIANAFWSNKVAPEQVFDLVFIGDSRIYRGIDPTTVEQKLQPFAPIKAFNFGFSSAGLAPKFMEEGAALLDTQSAHPILVLGINASVLADENLTNKHYWQEKNRSLWDKWQRKYLHPHLSAFDPTSPVVIKHHLEGDKQGYYQEHHPNGWIASDKIPRNEWQNYGHTQTAYPTATFSVSARKQLVQKVAEWEQKGIQVFAFRPPALAAIEAIETQQEYYPEKAIIAQLEAVGATWIEIKDRTQYITYDGSHLEQGSAKRLSAFLGEKIKESLETIEGKKDKAKELFSTVLGFEKFPQTCWQLKTTQIKDKGSFSGNNKEEVRPQNYSSTYEVPLDDYLKQHLTIQSSCWIKALKKEENAEVFLVLSIQDKEQTVLWKGQSFIEQTLDLLDWNQCRLSTTYRNIKAGCTLKAYVWNNSSIPIEIDDFKVTVLKH